MGRLGSVLLVLIGMVLVVSGYSLSPLQEGSSSAATPTTRLTSPADPGPVESSTSEAPAAATALPSVSPTVEVAVTPGSAPAVESVTPTPAASAARGDAASAENQRGVVGLPKRIKIPVIEVDAEIEFVGLTPEGAMDAPRDPDKIGWYRLGPRPGEPGNAAMAGHVDWAGRIRAFWGLKDLDPGDTIEVVSQEGARYRFAVRWVRSYDAAKAPLEEIFGSSGVPEITLITCGGVFDRRTKQYLSRVVVRGVMSDES